MAKKAIYISVILILVFSSLLLAACGKPETTNAPTTTPTTATATEPEPKPKYGGILKMIQYSSPVNLGYPAHYSFGDPPFILGCIERLFWTDLSNEPHPYLATKWELAADGKYLTVYLKEGVVFHDGTPFNAEAVQWNLMETKTENKVTGAELIDSVDIIDEHTVRINLVSYQSNIFYLLGGTVGYMVSPTAVKTNGVKWAKANPVGTGPFKFVEWQKDISVRYEKFDGYWQKGLPYLDGLEYHMFSDQITGSAAFQSGEFKLMSDVTPKLTADLVAAGYKTASLSLSTQVLIPDGDNPDSPFAKKEVRLAVDYALDKEGLAKAFGYGTWGPLYQFCVPAFTGYNPNLEEHRYDPDKARALLKEAGYPAGFDTTLYANPMFIEEDVVVSIQDMLNEVGIRANVKMILVGPFTEFRVAGWHNALMVQRITFQPDVGATFKHFLGVGPMGFISIYRAPGFLDLVDEELGQLDRQKQIAMAEDLVKLVHENTMVIPVVSQDRVYTMYQALHNTSFFTSGYPYHWLPESTWIGD